MGTTQYHTFHIPVMGLGYTIDTPVKVARFGISSVVSIIEDHLIEQMREFYCNKEQEEYIKIDICEDNHRAARITAYLNLLQKIINKQIVKIKAEPFKPGNEIVKYFEMLPDNTLVKVLFNKMMDSEGPEKELLQQELRNKIIAGSVDVNIMTKPDNLNVSATGEKLPQEYSNALAALRGFALSNLSASIIFSAGLNARLYSYCEQFPDFYPDENERIVKKIVLKVSDYRSAMIQGKFFAKKGIWISEFRIESGLNCGGHAFATNGLLAGPILEEFKSNREQLACELFKMCNDALKVKGKTVFTKQPKLKITYQGGIGTSKENEFLTKYYNLDGTGWGSPFLLVPEATNVDEGTLKLLAVANKDDYYLSSASPIGISFNNFRRSSAELQRHTRIENGKPGSPCIKKFLACDTEFTEFPICTASRRYQELKIAQIIDQKNTEISVADITAKDCLCEGLGASALLKNNIKSNGSSTAVTICPGPNLAFFSGSYSLQQMINHIYGRTNLLNTVPRPHLFINELLLYIDFLKKEYIKTKNKLTVQKEEYFKMFKANLCAGMEYYVKLFAQMKLDTNELAEQIKQMAEAKSELNFI